MKRRLDLTLSGAVVALMVPMLWYRYGLDQALYHYAGTAWLDGRLPFRDVFDIKPPGIYGVYALATALFGRGEIGIRVLEIAAVVATGRVCAAAVGDGEERPDGVAGGAALLLAAWYAGQFGYWDTGQAELWEGAFVVAAWAALVRGRRCSRAAFIAGVLAAVGTLFKLTALLPAIVLALAAGARAARQMTSHSPEHSDGRNSSKSAHREDSRKRCRWLRVFCLGAGMFTAGLLVPLAVVAAYFAAHGAFGSLTEWAGYVLHYARMPIDPTWAGLAAEYSFFGRDSLWYALFLAFGLLGASEVRRSSVGTEHRRVFVAFALLAAAVGSIIVQSRYFSYHPAVLGPFLALLAAHGLDVALRYRPALTVAVTALLALGGPLAATPWVGATSMSYRSYLARAWWPYVTGAIDRDTFDRTFRGPFGYDYATQAAVAEMILTRGPQPGDGLHVRGYAPVPYVLTGLYSPSRFMMETPVTQPYLRTYHPEWVIEHTSALLRRPPRFFVTWQNAPWDLEARFRKGYEELATIGPFVVLERADCLGPTAIDGGPADGRRTYPSSRAGRSVSSKSSMAPPVAPQPAAR